MIIWVDADACPKVIKEIIFRAAQRTQTLTILVANKLMTIPASPFIRFTKVNTSMDAADQKIVASVEKGDCVVTADIPLAAATIDKGAVALNPRGWLYTKENIKECLSLRDYLTDLRATGVNTRGPDVLSQKNRQDFANHLDKLLRK